MGAGRREGLFKGEGWRGLRPAALDSSGETKGLWAFPQGTQAQAVPWKLGLNGGHVQEALHRMSIVTLHLQSPTAREASSTALRDTFHDNNRVRLAVAYITVQGVQALGRLGCGFSAADIRKEILTSIDFGITEPSALDMLARQPNAEVRIVRFHEVLARGLRPLNAFHPKLYWGSRPDGQHRVVVGSQNVTDSALRSNWEAAMAGTLSPVDLDALATWWQREWANATPVDVGLVTAYREARPRQAPPTHPRAGLAEVSPLSEPRAVPLAEDAQIASLAAAGVLIFEAGSTSGGARTQVDLPVTLAPYFFTDDQVRAAVVGQRRVVRDIQMHHDGRVETKNFDLRLAAGENHMVRLNLPSRMRGLRLSAMPRTQRESSLLVFRRLPETDAFELDFVLPTERAAIEPLIDEAVACGQRFSPGRSRRTFYWL